MQKMLMRISEDMFALEVVVSPLWFKSDFV